MMGASTDAEPIERDVANELDRVASSINAQYLRLSVAHVRHLARQARRIDREVLPSPAERDR